MAWTWLARAGLVGVLLAGSAIGGCGDGGGDSSGPVSYAGQSESLTLKPSEAGKLELGAVKVAFPTGAVDQEVDVTLDVKAKKGQPDEANVAIDVYEFGPSMQFKQPVELEFDLAGVKVPRNKKAVVAVLDEEEKRWKKLPDSSASNGKVKGSTMHFSMFTVVFELSSTGGGQIGGQCSESFDACGGDIVGTWMFSGSCFSAPLESIIGTDSPILACQEPPAVAFDVDIQGTVTFNADGTMMVNQDSVITSGVTIPTSCLAEQGQDSGLSTEELCAQAGGALESTGCVISYEETDTLNESGTYTTSGSTLYTETVSTSETATDVPPEEGQLTTAPAPRALLKQAAEEGLSYCVQGNTLTVRETDVEGFVVEYTATRQ